MYRIDEILANGPSYSFEFFPPKTDAAADRLTKTITNLEPLNPSFVSVTYGAGGSTRERTHDLVVRLLDETSIPSMAHLTCIGHTRAELTKILEHYADSGVNNVLALRGDPPKDDPDPIRDLPHATDLVELIRTIGGFSVGVAAHPEGHPESQELEQDLAYQARKLKTADFAVTQFFFTAEDYFRFRDAMSSRGIDTPIIPGIMPVTNPKMVARMAEMSGAVFPHYLESKLNSARTPEDARAIGLNACTRMCQHLIQEEVPGLHFYTLNKSSATQEIYRNLGLGKLSTRST